jgi:hypothetical protein
MLEDRDFGVKLKEEIDSEIEKINAGLKSKDELEGMWEE